MVINTLTDKRRSNTKKSGFSVHRDTTGGEFINQNVKTYSLKGGESVEISFIINGHAVNDLLGFGAWFHYVGDVDCVIHGFEGNKTLTAYGSDKWNKLGSIWEASDLSEVSIDISFRAKEDSKVAVYKPTYGKITHTHLSGSRKSLLTNMYEFAPEALFVNFEAVVSAPSTSVESECPIVLKSCNRCARYLPVNITNERDHLSFTNHCVAAHRLPCKHSTFGKLCAKDGRELELIHGFQLECRFCKKFEVNAPHNPQRSSSQMKEDGARRRAFEMLLGQIGDGKTPQLRYRHEHGSELSNDIWEAFGRKCFNCSVAITTLNQMHLDHTRPLALLWPLDETATSLCKTCNSSKRDRNPVDFYSPAALIDLAARTGIPLDDLLQGKPNEVAMGIIVDKIKWLFEVFLQNPMMIKVRDGKVTGDLVLKSLQRAFSKSSRYESIDLRTVYQERGG